VAIKKIA